MRRCSDYKSFVMNEQVTGRLSSRDRRGGRQHAPPNRARARRAQRLVSSNSGQRGRSNLCARATRCDRCVSSHPLSSSLCSFPLFSYKHSNSDLHSYANGSVHSFTIEQNEHFSFYMAEVTKIPKDKNTQIGILNHSIRNNL